MDNNGINFYKSDFSVHDNIITSYEVDFINNKIIIYTNDKNERECIIEFSEVLTHYFECILNFNIISDIQTFDIDKFINDNRIQLKELECMAWQENLELKEFLITKNYKYMRLSSSYGMCGWILAKEYKVINS